MAWLAGAIRKEVTRHRTLRTWERGTCLHIAVSDGLSLFNYFNVAGNPTSHFYVRKTGSTPAVQVGTPLSPYMADYEQYVDTIYRAPAQLEGNPTLISFESQGGVGADLDNGWTGPQMERIAWCLAQCHKIHGTPLPPMPDSLSSRTGTGHHRLGIDPWRVDNGELWSRSFGKVCPGDARMAQKPKIITRAWELIAPPPAPTPIPEDDGDMFITRYGSSTYRMFIDRRVISLSEATYNTLEDGGVPVKQLSNAAVEALASICTNYLLVDSTPTSGTEDAYLISLQTQLTNLAADVDALQVAVEALAAPKA